MKTPVHFFRLVCFVVGSLSWLSASSQCGCNFTLTGLKTTSVNIIDASSFPTYKAGDVFCINAGTYAELRLIDFHGTADKPLIFKNCGGKVVIEGITYPGIQFRNSSFIRVTGTGNSNFFYGIHIAKAKDGVAGVSIQDLSTDFEVDHLEISNVGFAGIIAKTDPDCARPETWRENFLMKNLHFHDNHIHNIGGEGFYVGGTFGYESTKRHCDLNGNGVLVDVFAHLLENVKITNNIIEDTGWDGLQLNLTLVNAEVSNNSIYGYGWKKEFAQNQGISLGSSTIKMFNNTVIQKPEYAVPDSYGISMVSPFPGSYIFNNVVANSGDYGIWTHVRTPSLLLGSYDLTKPENGIYFINNTIVDAGASGMFYNARDGSDPRGDDFIHAFYNNLIVDPTTVYTEGTFWKKPGEAFIDYNDKEQKDFAQLDKNLLSRDKSAIKFADVANRNFNILTGSQAIDFGRAVSTVNASFGLTFDHNNGARPVGTGFDAGAYEFGASNQAPIADSGNGSSILVGQTATLNGSASNDPDGTISNYAWTKVSGPSSPTITNASSAQASVTISTAGTYIYKLTVTDNDGASASDEVQVNVGSNNQSPVANAGTDITISAGQTAALNGSASSDPDGTITTYAWTRVSGPSNPTITNASSAQASVTINTAGVYVYKLTVTDNSGTKTSDQVQVTVTSNNVLPVANAGPGGSFLTGQSVTLNGSASSDQDGTITAYAWTKVSGPSSPVITNASQVQASVIISTVGTYVFRLTVTDNSGAKNSAEVQIIIDDVITGILNGAPNFEKIATVYPNPTSQHSKAVVKFNFSKPTDVYMEFYSINGSLLSRLPRVENATNETTVDIDLKGLVTNGKVVVLLLKTASGNAAKRILIQD